MINSFEVKGKIKGKFHFANKLFKSNMLFEFKPGVNIIVGENGSGKSTLINIMKYITYCRGVNYSHAGWIRNIIDHPHFYEELFEFIKQIDIKGDYRWISFNLADGKELAGREGPDAGMVAVDIAFKDSNSGGEKKLNEMNYLLLSMFDKDKEKYRNGQELGFEDCYKYHNSLDKNRQSKLVNSLIEYHKRNQIDSDTRQFTLFMDEPDVSLDIIKVKELLTWFIKPRDDVQVIAVLHNPFLIKTIYKKNPNVNFINFTKGYLEMVLKEVSAIED